MRSEREIERKKRKRGGGSRQWDQIVIITFAFCFYFSKNLSLLCLGGGLGFDNCVTTNYRVQDITTYIN
jgi:hypothetical protein